MLFYSLHEILIIVAAAIVIDWVVGDPPWPTHPVIVIGRVIKRQEAWLRPEGRELSPAQLRRRGCVLALGTLAAALGTMTAIVAGLTLLHPWAGYAAHAWFISTTMAVNGLREAAIQVYRPLAEGNLEAARTAVGYIVGRDTSQLGEGEIARAAVETVAENTVDAFLSPVCYALLGGAPLAMLYRAANTLDSMVGYKNERYLHFGWASARWDDVMNLIPARLSAPLLALAAIGIPGLSPVRALQSVKRFARLHPSPNSGFPESAVAGALGVQLGGRNTYGGVESIRASMGWPLRLLGREDIRLANKLLWRVSVWIAGGMLCVFAILR